MAKTQDIKINIRAKDKTKGTLKKVTGALNTLRKKVLSTKTAFAGLAGIAGMGLLISRSAQAIDTLGKLSTRLGISSKALSEYQYMAGLAGMSTETANMSLQRFQRKIAEAASGMPEMSKVFKELNIEVTDMAGNTRDAQAVLEDVADAFSNTEDKAERLRLAVRLFDSEGAAMIQILSNGTVAMKEMAKEAVEFGLVLGVNQVKAVEASNDAIFRLTSRFKGFTRQLTAALAPAIKVITNMMGSWLDSLRGDQSMNEWAVSAANSMMEFGRKASLIFLDIKSKVKELWAELGGTDMLKDGKLQIQLAVPKVLEELATNFNKILSSIDRMNITFTSIAAMFVTVSVLIKAIVATFVASMKQKGVVAGGKSVIDNLKKGQVNNGKAGKVNNGKAGQVRGKIKRYPGLAPPAAKGLPWWAKGGAAVAAALTPGTLNEGEDAMFEPGGQYYNKDWRLTGTDTATNPSDKLPLSSPANDAMKSIRLAAEAETSLLEEKIIINKFFDSLLTTPQDIGELEVVKEASNGLAAAMGAINDMNFSGANQLFEGLETVDMEAEMANAEAAMALMEANWERRQTVWDTLGRSMTAGFNTYAATIKTELDMMADNFASAFQHMEDAMFQFVTTGKLNFKDLFTSIASDFLRSGVKSVLSNMFKTGGGAGGDNPLSSWLGFANGGQPPLNTPSIVGERGPEIFVPKQAGTIIPNHAMGGGQTANITFQVNSLDPSTAADVIVSNRKVIEGVIANAFNSRGRVGFA